METLGFYLSDFINYCENETSEEQWCLDVVRSKDGSKNCLLGHLFEYGCIAGGEDKANKYWDFFESCFATTYMVSPVNDGKTPNYQQSTPKQRCLAYLRDLESGKAKTTHDYMQEMAGMQQE